MPYITYIKTNDTQLDATKILDHLYGKKVYAVLEHQEYSKNYLSTRTMHIPSPVDRPPDWGNMITLMSLLATECASFLRRNPDTATQYTEFYIPKHSGGLRKINAPNEEIASLQRLFIKILKDNFKILEHNNAFAYVSGRATKDALIRHSNNNSKWFLKLDVKDFFPSCTKEFILSQFKEIYPLCFLEDDLLSPIIDVCLLDGGLPQGAPSSPYLTNIIMIPIDYKLNKKLYDFNKSHYCVTRYADDILISNKFNFNYTPVLNLVNEVFTEVGATFRLNSKKTRYASNAGRNWNLGLMYNNQGKITVGHKRKKRTKSALYAMFRDNHQAVNWDVHDAQVVIGELAYIQQVEQGALNSHILKLEQRYNISWSVLKKCILNPD